MALGFGGFDVGLPRGTGLQFKEASGKVHVAKRETGKSQYKFKRGAAREGGEEDSATGQYWASRGKFRSLKSKLATETFRPEIGGERAARFHHVSICVHNTCLIQQTLMFIDVADKATVTAGYSGHYFDTDAHLTST